MTCRAAFAAANIVNSGYQVANEGFHWLQHFLPSKIFLFWQDRQVLQNLGRIANFAIFLAISAKMSAV